MNQSLYFLIISRNLVGFRPIITISRAWSKHDWTREASSSDQLPPQNHMNKDWLWSNHPQYNPCEWPREKWTTLNEKNKPNQPMHNQTKEGRRNKKNNEWIDRDTPSTQTPSHHILETKGTPACEVVTPIKLRLILLYQTPLPAGSTCLKKKAIALTVSVTSTLQHDEKNTEERDNSYQPGERSH